MMIARFHRLAALSILSSLAVGAAPLWSWYVHAANALLAAHGMPGIGP